MSCRIWLLLGLGGSLLATGVASGNPLRLNQPQARSAAVSKTATDDPAPTPETEAAEYPSTDDAPATGRRSSLPRDTESLSPELKRLRGNVRRALAVYSGPRLNSRDNNPWELLHSIVAYGVQSEIREGGPDGRVINAIGCLCYNFPCRGYQVLDIQEGRVTARKGVGVQGHHGQMLAILAQSHVPVDYNLSVNGKTFTVADLVETEKLTCDTGMELTFKLISLAHYLDSDATWKNFQGNAWSIQRLIKEEIKAPIVGAACGGTHRLMGLSYAVHKRRDAGKPINGEFNRAKLYTDDFHAYTFKLQNADGSFSTEWFRNSGASPDLARRLQTTGHILEWLAYSLPDEELTEPRMVRAVAYLSDMLLADTGRQWEIGTLGHGMHALALYDQRVFKPLDHQAPIADSDDVLPLPAVAQPVEPAMPEVAEADEPRNVQPSIVYEDPAAPKPGRTHSWQIPRRAPAWQR